MNVALLGFTTAEIFGKLKLKLLFSLQQCGNKCVDILTYKYCQCHTDRIQNNQCRVNDKFECKLRKKIIKLIDLYKNVLVFCTYLP